MGNLELSADLLPEKMHFVDGHGELLPHLAIFFRAENSVLVLA